MRRVKSVEATPAAKMNKFMRRLSWNQRVEDYMFSKNQLQRQPSFVITPDISSYSYNFKNCDLAKPKPRVRFLKMSQPIAVWKNSRPLDVLKNPGHIDIPSLVNITASNQLKHGQKSIDDAVSSPLRVTPINPPVVFNGPARLTTSCEAISDKLRSRESILSGHRTDVKTKFVTSNSETKINEVTKIQLPFKTHQNSSSSEAHRLSDPLSDISHRSRASWLDTIPQTPIDESKRRRSELYTGDRVRYSVLSNHLDTRQNPLSHVLDATLIEALGSENADISLDQVAPPIPLQSASRATARTANVSPPQSPTSAKSSYRPESWRRSALIARGGLGSDIVDSSLDNAETERNALTEAWSRYLRRAVAQRVMEKKDRRSWELKNELQWSINLEWESETNLDSSDVQSSCEELRKDDTESDAYSVANSESGSTTSHGHSSSGFSGGNCSPQLARTARSPSAALSSSSSESNSGSQTAKKSQPDLGGDSPRAVMGNRKSHRSSQVMSPIADSPEKKSTSKLAPLHSPRQLTSSSRVALASINRLSFGDALDNALEKYTTLFNEEAAAWQPEVLSTVGDACSATSLSYFNEADDMFSSQQENRISLHTDHVHKYESLPAGVPKSRDLKMNEYMNLASSDMQSHVPLGSLKKTPENKEADFDFSGQNSNRKRALPLSPKSRGSSAEDALSLRSFRSSHSPKAKLPNVINTTLLHGCSDKPDLETSILVSQARGSSTSLESTPENTEAAAQIVRSQSQWKKKALDSKRVRTSQSQERLLHSRQKRMESMWGGEEQDSNDGHLD